MKNRVTLFEGRNIRRFYDEETEIWYFSVIDVVEILTDSSNPRDYWFKMKVRVKNEDGAQLSTICRQLKMKAPDGKMRTTDTANPEGLLRIIQSIPSPNRTIYPLKMITPLTLENSGHMGMFEEPETVLEGFEKWLQKFLH